MNTITCRDCGGKGLVTNSVTGKPDDCYTCEGSGREDRHNTMNTTLQQAQAAWQQAQNYYDESEARDGNAFWRSRSDAAKADAAILAQLAQAEALTRIAEILEIMLEQDTLSETVRIWGSGEASRE